MGEWIAQFLDHIACERGLSANTRAAYENDLTAFREYLQTRCGVSDFGLATRDHIAGFLSGQRRKGMRPATVARRLVAVRIFFAFLCAEGYLANNVTEVMSSPRKGRVLPRTLSEADVGTLLTSICGERPFDVRDRSMLELFYACGLRVSEVIALRVSDVRIEERLVRCVGKGNKQRVVPLGNQASQWLTRYLALSRPAFAKGDASEQAFFLTRRGAPFTRQGVFDMLVKRARAARIGARLSPHVLRHCFASHLLAHGANVRAIQEMLGHADIATTQVYTHVDVEHVTRTHALFHPRHSDVRAGS